MKIAHHSTLGSLLEEWDQVFMLRNLTTSYSRLSSSECFFGAKENVNPLCAANTRDDGYILKILIVVAAIIMWCTF